QLEQAYDEQSRNSLRNLIDKALLLQIAKEQGLSAEVEVVKAMDQMRQEHNLPSMDALESEIVKQGLTVEEVKDNIRTRVLSDQVIQHEVRVQVTTEDARNYYETNKKDFDRPEGVRLQEITVFTDKRTPEQEAAQRAKIDEALAAVKKG